VDGGLYFEKVRGLLCKMTGKREIQAREATWPASQALELAANRRVRFCMYSIM